MHVTWLSGCTMLPGLQAFRIVGCQSPFSITLLIAFFSCAKKRKAPYLWLSEAAWPSEGQSLESLKTHRFRLSAMSLLSSVTRTNLGRDGYLSILVHNTGKHYLPPGLIQVP